MTKLEIPREFVSVIDALEKENVILDYSNYGISFLSKVNYKRLLYFNNLIKMKKSKVFLSHIYYYSLFDNDLRILFFEILASIEVSIKAQVALNHGYMYGDYGYLYQKNYSSRSNRRYSQGETIFEKLINRFIGECSREFGNGQEIKELTVWDAIEAMSFGSVSKMYGLFEIKIQKKIASYYKIPYNLLDEWLHGITILRNKCCHHSILLGKNMPIPIATHNDDLLLYGDVDSRSYFNYILAIKRLLVNKKKWKYFASKLDVLMKKYNVSRKLLGIAHGFDLYE